MNICVFGAASDKIDQEYINIGEMFGEAMAKRGHNLVFGAGRNGMMGAAARGVKKGGGKIYGVIPEFFKKDNIEQIYLQCDELYYTETMAERKTKMEAMADAFVIIPGGIGTFEEMFEVLTLKQLAQHSKPIAVYNINNYYDNFEALIRNSCEQGFIRENCMSLYKCSDNCDEIFDYIENDKLYNLSVHDLKNG